MIAPIAMRISASRSSRVHLSAVAVLLLAPVLSSGVRAGAAGGPDASRSLVKISAAAQGPDYRQPWNPGKILRGVGAGFVVEGGRIMTNAHVVSDARFLAVEKEGDPRPYIARAEHVAHDCDLALLQVEDARFFEGTRPLEFGGLPEIESTVFAYGYPLGGSRYSVTRGVVSRIDFQPYEHSHIDSHLAIQIDAAINPGNSGGPVMQDGKVVGVAFQGFSADVAQNVGYMIPTPVVHRFLRDIADGRYDRYVDLAVTTFELVNPAQRRALGLGEDDERGLLVCSVLAGGSADGHLKPGDVLLAIDGLPITGDGLVELDGRRVEMPEVVERKLDGDHVRLRVLRERAEIDVSFQMRPFLPALVQANSYDAQPEFVLHAGLLFQPLSRALMGAHRIEDLQIRYLYENYVEREFYAERPQIVVLSSILPDPVNTYLEDLVPAAVSEINGRRIRSLADVARALREGADPCVIRLEGKGRPIVLERAAAERARERILRQYNVSVEQRITPRPE